MEITKKCRFITPFYGTQPASGHLNTVLNWIDDKITEGILSWADQQKKKGEKADEFLVKILSKNWRDENDYPVIGAHQVRCMLIAVGKAIFNAKKNKNHPKQDIIPHSILPVIPMPFISIYNGDIVKTPAGIDTRAVSIRSPRKSFFAAYEWVPAGTTFEFTASFDTNLISEENAEEIIKYAGRFGLGGFREQFGKFEYIN